jgi:predicted glycogen debranching enzyme
MHFSQGFPEDLMKLLNYEWIVSTGSGAFATSTASLANTRKQQGIFIAPTREGFKRYLYVSRIEDELIREGGNLDLTTCVYRDAVFPGGYKNLKDYSLHPRPKFVFADEFSSVRKTVQGIPGENSIVLKYAIESVAEGSLKLRPVLGLRYIHTLRREKEISLGIRPSVRGVFFRPGEHPVPPLIMLSSSGEYRSDFCWYRNFSYMQDRDKGDAWLEDLPSPGYFLVPVNKGKTIIFVIFSLEERWLNLLNGQARTIELQIKKALKRRVEQVSRDRLPQQFQKNFTPVENSALSLVSSVGDRSFAMAGYPYFPVNVYDLVLFIKDFLLRGGYISTASSMIDFLSPFIRYGILPKYIDEGGEPVYCAADTSLLYVELLSRYLALTGSRAEIERNLQLMGEIVNAYMDGTEFETKMGDDYLITCGREGIEATWMDRIAEGEHINRRHGRAVDTNALWYNALCVYRDLSMAVGYKKESQKITKIIPRIKSSFLKNFVMSGEGYLVDVIQDGKKDPRLRPNQLFALTLSHPLVSPTFGRRVLQKIKDSLVTDYGLRTLAPQYDEYAGTLEGNERERLHALFNGCVLPHFALQYTDALLYVYGPKSRVVNRVRRFLLALRRAADNRAPYFLPEAFDGAPPHEPKGSPVSLASTGSVMGLFRLYDSITTSS